MSSTVCAFCQTSGAFGFVAAHHLLLSTIGWDTKYMSLACTVHWIIGALWLGNLRERGFVEKPCVAWWFCRLALCTTESFSSVDPKSAMRLVEWLRLSCTRYNLTPSDLSMAASFELPSPMSPIDKLERKRNKRFHPLSIFRYRRWRTTVKRHGPTNSNQLGLVCAKKD